MYDQTAKNNIRLRVQDVSHTGSTQKGMLAISVPGYSDRNILFSTPEVAEGIAKLMKADFDGKSVSFVEEEDWTTVFIE